jgi:glucoside 3-dehydrogenase (cytochrome c) hitch-hiker subunit
MHRRDLLRLIGASALIPFVPGEADAAVQFGQATHRAVRVGCLRALSSEEARVVTVLADMIIPATDSPGASDVDVTGFIDHLLADWYSPEDRQQLQAGIGSLVTEGFADLSGDQRIARLTALDRAMGEPGSPEAAVSALKSLTVYGYFTSERVMKEVTRDPIIPGRFEGCVRF